MSVVDLCGIELWFISTMMSVLNKSRSPLVDDMLKIYTRDWRLKLKSQIDLHLFEP